MSTSKRRKELMELLAPMQLNAWQRNQIIMYVEADRSNLVTRTVIGTVIFVACVCVISYFVFYGG